MNIAVFFIMLAIFSTSWCGFGFDILRSIWPHGTMSTGGVSAIWVVIYLGVIGLLCYGIMTAKKYYREFKLDWCRVIDERFFQPDMLYPVDDKAVFEIPSDVREFWLNLENSAKGEMVDNEVVYHVEPVLYLDRNKMPYASNDDVIHVTIAKNGAVNVSYLDNHCTTGEIQWSMSEVKSK